VLYTDGVTETRGRDELFGVDRLHALASEHGHKGPAPFLAELERALDAFAHGSRRDDVAALALRPNLAPLARSASARASGLGPRASGSRDLALRIDHDELQQLAVAVRADREVVDNPPQRDRVGLVAELRAQHARPQCPTPSSSWPGREEIAQLTEFESAAASAWAATSSTIR